ncbi:MAG TPA: class I SAM-dependent methyltransferase [Pyrinomonadaceae bacterium]|jgi:ubiquinone/menaquinone biosynthesis C-methylase UbiE
MKQHAETITNRRGGAAALYDRFADLYDITFKFNGYGRSLERYFRTHPLPLQAGAQVLDAGCGTGLLTLALLSALPRPARITALDLSAPSLAKARHAVSKTQTRLAHQVRFIQGNLLALPFAAATFDFIATSGALEYVPLAAGLGELARVLRPGGYLLHLPVRPSPASTFLEILFRFKTHPPAEVDAATTRYFHIVSQYHFPPLDVIGWTKTAILAQKQ